MTPKEEHMKIWLIRWHESKSVDESCTLYQVFVDEMARTS
jgi:hypothetical protein